MNLYEVSPIEVTPLGYASHLVAAASKKQAADSFGADYWEFYDRNTDNNGYLEIWNELKFQSPNDETTLLYQFNKRRMESFIYDIESRIYRGTIK